MQSITQSIQDIQLDKGPCDHNVLMSLPTCLVHCILADWIGVISLLKLDIALLGNKRLHAPLIELLKSNTFHLKEVTLKGELAFRSSWREQPPNHPFSKMLNWLTLRRVKVLNIELHEHCCLVGLEKYLQHCGENVRHVHPNGDYKERFAPNPSYLIAKYCHNLISYSVCTNEGVDGRIFSVLLKNARLKTLFIFGSLRGANNPTEFSNLELLHLEMLYWNNVYRFDESLVALVTAAPNLQILSICCNPNKSTEIRGDLILAVGRACCANLRVFSCKELHIGPNDSFLKPFLTICHNIVVLDLFMHQELTDTVLVEALSELTSLYSLDLRGCSRLTDKTLEFLAQRFESTLTSLYIDNRVSSRSDIEGESEEGNLVGLKDQEQRGYTAEGIANLRMQCSYLEVYLEC